MEHLEVKWSSQAALLQRKGRIGRVAPGVVLRLIPSNHPLPEFPTPSIQNSALKQLFLLAKSYRMSICDEPIALL
jgi:HrpA-like RNA helicase